MQGRNRRKVSVPTVRFGGIQTPRGYRFEISGGHLCLDLANTVDERPAAEPRELLPRYEDLVAWGLQSGAIDGPTARSLRRAAQRRPQTAARALQRARSVREAIFGIFSALAGRRAPPAPAVGRLNAALAAALAGRRLARRAGGFTWDWTGHVAPDLDRVLWPAVVSAAELLTSGGSDRVRECASDRCAWLFLDRSKNRSRRWCDMTVCGNRTKARRYYERARWPGARSGR
jgi:predicted RNA-binding Zn ribbon-like protein